MKVAARLPVASSLGEGPWTPGRRPRTSSSATVAVVAVWVAPRLELGAPVLYDSVSALGRARDAWYWLVGWL